MRVMETNNYSSRSVDPASAALEILRQALDEYLRHSTWADLGRSIDKAIETDGSEVPSLKTLQRWTRPGRRAIPTSQLHTKKLHNLAQVIHLDDDWHGAVDRLRASLTERTVASDNGLFRLRYHGIIDAQPETGRDYRSVDLVTIHRQSASKVEGVMTRILPIGDQEATPEWRFHGLHSGGHLYLLFEPRERSDRPLSFGSIHLRLRDDGGRDWYGTYTRPNMGPLSEVTRTYVWTAPTQANLTGA